MSNLENSANDILMRDAVQTAITAIDAVTPANPREKLVQDRLATELQDVAYGCESLKSVRESDYPMR